MIRALWSMLVAMLWVRQRTANARAAKSLKVWSKFCDTSLPLKANPKDPIESHVKHYVQQAKADELSEVAVSDNRRFKRRQSTYTRAANFMPRWVWAYVPYAEVVAAGIGVGYLAQHNPDVLSAGLHAAVRTAGAAWSVVESMQSRVGGWNWDVWSTLAIAGMGFGGVGAIAFHAVRDFRKLIKTANTA